MILYYSDNRHTFIPREFRVPITLIIVAFRPSYKSGAWNRSVSASPYFLQALLKFSMLFIATNVLPAFDLKEQDGN